MSNAKLTVYSLYALVLNEVMSIEQLLYLRRQNKFLLVLSECVLYGRWDTLIRTLFSLKVIHSRLSRDFRYSLILNLSRKHFLFLNNQTIHPFHYLINILSFSYHAQSVQFPHIKQIREDRGEVHSRVFQDTLHRIDKTFDTFLRRCHDLEMPGYPRIQAKRAKNCLGPG
jgi:hypothetical protein